MGAGSQDTEPAGDAGAGDQLSPVSQWKTGHLGNAEAGAGSFMERVEERGGQRPLHRGGVGLVPGSGAVLPLS